MEFFETYPTDKLIPYARNSRTHNDEQIAQIVASIKEFGFTNPILIDNDDVIVKRWEEFTGHKAVLEETSINNFN